MGKDINCCTQESKDIVTRRESFNYFVTSQELN